MITYTHMLLVFYIGVKDDGQDVQKIRQELHWPKVKRYSLFAVYVVANVVRAGVTRCNPFLDNVRAGDSRTLNKKKVCY